jgi:Lar family restriction alleviation protein
MSDDLKPCPFCTRGTTYRHTSDFEIVGMVMIGCSACGALGPGFDADDEEDGEAWAKAVEAWNTRAAIAAIDQSQSADAEQGAWEWLGSYSQQRHSEAPEDVAFTADQMVDAYLAGRALLSQPSERQAESIGYSYADPENHTARNLLNKDS